MKKELPEIDLKELEKFKERNFRERLAFQDMYVEWLKKTDNIRGSSQQKSLINAAGGAGAPPGGAVRKNRKNQSSAAANKKQIKQKKY